MVMQIKLIVVVVVGIEERVKKVVLYMHSNEYSKPKLIANFASFIWTNT